MTPNMVPMIDKDGNAGMVPQDRVQDAIQSDSQMRVGFHVDAPDGSEGVIPAERLHEVLKQPGYKLHQAAQPTDAQIATATSKPQTADPGFLEGAWQGSLRPLWQQAKQQQSDIDSAPDFGSKVEAVVGNALKNTPEAQAAKMIAGALQSAYSEGKKSLSHVGAAGKAAASGDMEGAAREIPQAEGHALAAVTPFGSEASEIGEDFAAHHPKLAAGKLTGLAAKLLLFHKIGSGAADEAAPMQAKEAAGKLTDAVNPAPADMPKFRADMEEHLPRIAEHAERNGIALTDRPSLLKATRGAAEEHQELYDKQLLEPVKDQLAPNGKTFGELESRLRHLNRTTDYRPTTGAEAEAQVARKAEAADIRKQLNEGIGKKLGVKPEQVAEARAAGEKLSDLADKTELAMDVERHGANAQARSSVTVHGHGGRIPGTPVGGGRVSAAVTKTANRVFGNPADNAVRDVFQNLKTEKPSISTPNAPKPQPSTRKVPASQTAKPDTAEPTFHASTESELKQDAARSERNQDGRKMQRAVNDALKAENAGSHGASRGSTATIGEQLQAKEAASAAAKSAAAKSHAAAGKGLEWPAEYRNSARNLSNKGGGGANYTAADLEALKKKHNL